MVSIEKIREGLREEGLNSGLPVTFIVVGFGDDYPRVQDLVEEIWKITNCNNICIVGRDTTQVGMGSLVKGLSALGLKVELECPGYNLTPGWFSTVSNWVIEYGKTSNFNYSCLRNRDMVRFTVRDKKDLSLVEFGLEQLKLCPATKYIKVSKGLLRDTFNLIKGMEVRIYVG